jgi:hypothetical protein
LLESLNPRKWEVRVAGASTLAGELTQMVEDFEPAAALISSLPPGGAAHARYLCKRLRQRGPELKIMVAAGATRNARTRAMKFAAAGANDVLCSVSSARRHLQSWRPAFVSARKGATRNSRTGRRETVRPRSRSAR